MGEHAHGGGIRDDYVICLECDKALQLLSHRHLALHGLAPDAYRQKWGISSHIPLMSQRVAQHRYELAKRLKRNQQTRPGENAYQHGLALLLAGAEMDDFFHELAEALTFIQGQVYLAQKYLSSYMRPQEYLEAIQHTVMRMGQRMQGDLPTP